MRSLLHLSLILAFSFSNMFAQETQIGGFTYGWENYDNTDEEGLGQREVAFNYDGIRSIVHAPEIGIHPRIYFGPSEIPDIKQRLENTASGRAIMAQIHAYTTLLHLGAANYNHNSTYGLDESGNRWVGNTGFWDSQKEYNQLVNEDLAVWDDVTIKRKHMTACMMSLLAFECLIKQGAFDEDTQTMYNDRANDLAKAMTFWAELALADSTLNGLGNNYNHFGGSHMALAFDLNYHAMTDNQRSKVREALAKIVRQEPNHGAHLLAYANTSNWTTLNTFELVINLAIEGEEGYNADLTERWMRALHNFINYGWYPSGAGYEGLGKNYQYATTLIACAKRGYSLLGHPHVRAYGESFLPAIMQPFGHGYTSYDVWGGSGHDDEKGKYKFNSSDAVGLKWIFPENPSIDFVWRNYIEQAYENNSEGYVYQQIRPDDSYQNYLIPAAVFASDYNQGDWSTQAENTVQEDYLASDRGLAIMKSDKSSDAIAVQFHCRQDMGGHTHGDRNDFTLSALGRIWIRKSYGGSQFQPTWFHSTMIIDGKGVAVGDPDGDKCRQPGKLLDWETNDQFSLVAGDATYAYTWDWHWSPHSEGVDHPWLGGDWSKVEETWNDFQFEEKTEAHFDIPFYEFPHWHQPYKYERMIKRLHNPMEKVIRSVAVVRNERPYALVIDDIQKDENVHNYQWLGQVARDLTIEEIIKSEDDNGFRNDIILKEPSTTGQRRLLIRILQNEHEGPNEFPIYMDTLDYQDYFTGNPYNSNPNYIRPRLIIESDAVSPELKIMLFPYVEGESLPITNWNAAKDSLVVTIDENTQTFRLEKDNTGRTLLSLYPIDADGDGYASDVDCDDSDPAINPDAEEIANNSIDEDCDGIATIIDQDGDGFNSDEDCDDLDPEVNSEASEIPNNDLDEDCDGIALIIDQDGDGFNSDEDCDDLDPEVNSEASEIPNNDVDEDCDGIALIIDEDGDGFNSDQDCDDSDPEVNSGASEIPNNDVDEDCDGIALIIDEDGDGFNSDEDCDDLDPEVNSEASEIPNNDVDEDCDGIALIIDEDGDGFNSDEDCDDANDAVNPGQAEIPNNDIDEDCDGEALIIDEDGDGFNSDEDCDDFNAEINPSVAEVCDEIDNNCNGEIDEGLNIQTYYVDSDMDGYGDSDNFIEFCSQPPGTSTENGDCDDTNPGINPGATEVPNNEIDEDCDGEVLIIDADGDGFNSDVDCDDSDPAINPDAEEIANNGIDEDCDGEDLISSTKDLLSSKVKLFPNPVEDKLHLVNESGLIMNYQISNINGQKMSAGVLDEKLSLIQTNHLLPGIYYLIISDPTELYTLIKFAKM